MNKLKVFTQPTDSPDTYLVYWTNNLICPKGVIKAIVPGQMEDKMIAAELRAIQYLLEERWVLGEHAIGNANMLLIVSLGAIKKLKHKRSDKAHLARYAEFLCTRFAGCKLEIDKDDRLFKEGNLEQTELIVTAPVPENVELRGIGRVSVTRHVLERLAKRLPADRAADPAKAWKMLQRMASDPSVKEVGRNSDVFTRLSFLKRGQNEGRYFLNPKMNMILVVADNARGKNLVTTYSANSRFFNMTAAA